VLETNLKPVLKKARELKAKRLLLQFPEGLKTKAKEFAEEFEKNGFETVLLMDPCFGACDINLNLIKQFGADLIIHFGHRKIFGSQKIIYVPFEYFVEAQKIRKLVQKLSEKNAGSVKHKKSFLLCATANYLNWLPALRKEIEKNNFTAKILKGSERVSEKGMVLGCNYSALRGKADAVVFLGDGLFHPLGASYATSVPVYALNPKTLEVKTFEKEKELYYKKRIFAISNAKEARTFGLIVSTKMGQFQLKRALKAKKMIESKGKTAILFAMNHVQEEQLLGINIDCFVNFACPRIVADDAQNWKKNIINPNELEIALGKKSFEEMQFEEIN
jgi:2-(3-amino-3-carboxypropyl)histidine synthase